MFVSVDRHSRYVEAGVSLVEVLMSLVVVTLSLMTVYTLLVHSTNISRQTLRHSAYHMVMTSLVNEVEPENPNFFYDYEATTNPPLNTVNDNGPLPGTPIPYARKSQCPQGMFYHQIYHYVYKTPQDNLSKPVARAQQIFDINEIRVNSGLTNGAYVDTSAKTWMRDAWTEWDWHHRHGHRQHRKRSAVPHLPAGERDLVYHAHAAGRLQRATALCRTGQHH
jgi:hypothetical protein